MLDAHKPMFGACLGGQQIAKTVGAKILDAPHKRSWMGTGLLEGSDNS